MFWDNSDNNASTAIPSNHSLVNEELLQKITTMHCHEIDWHEVTNFANGDYFTSGSSTAKQFEKIVSFGCEELRVAFKHLQHGEIDLVVEEAEKCISCMMNTGWSVVSHWELPSWLRDNDFLWHSHRPHLLSIKQCFCSMFRIHTETGNIWTHFIGMLLALFAMFVVFFRPQRQFEVFPRGYEEYLVFSVFFIGCICCLMFSWLFHTCLCHSESTSKWLNKLDYTGISLVIIGGFIPCIYFGFYCDFYKKLIYTASLVLLGLACIVISFINIFATPKYRPFRAGLFMSLGLSLLIPCAHMAVENGFWRAANEASLLWLFIMAVCAIGGALLYAVRVPERFFPGKCNVIFQSHQIFHILVVVGIFFHLHGCCEMALYRIHMGRNCTSANNSTLLQQSNHTTY